MGIRNKALKLVKIYSKICDKIEKKLNIPVRDSAINTNKIQYTNKLGSLIGFVILL